MEQRADRRSSWKNILFLQLFVLIYSLSSVCAKFAASAEGITFFLFYGLELVCLGLYALGWQRAISHFDISVAYANKGSSILWVMLLSALIFQETVTLPKIIGGIIIIIGIVVVNSEHS